MTRFNKDMIIERLKEVDSATKDELVAYSGMKPLSFSKTLAIARKELIEKGVVLDAKVTDGVWYYFIREKECNSTNFKSSIKLC